MRLVYLSPVPWSSFAQRPQKFVEWFHLRTGGQVLWVDPYPTRLPQLNDLIRASASTPGEAQEHYPWLELLKPRALPIEPLPGIARANDFFWRPVLSRLREFTQAGDALIVIGKPSRLALSVLKHLDHIPSVYDAMDEFPAFYKGLSRLSMAAREKSIVRQAKQMWVTSTRLKLRWEEYRADLQVVPNGLDPSHFDHAPNQSIGAKNSVFGYVGTIASWFDWNWVIQLAKARPNDVIRLIGPNFSPSNEILPGNVQLLPPCSHDEAMQALRNFDVGLIPFRRNELTASVDPIKFYEYRASGLPVISTAFGEMNYRSCEPGTFISQSTSDIPDLAYMALQYRDKEDFQAGFVCNNSWSARFDGTSILKPSKAS